MELNQIEIRKILDHRYPFLLVDRILDVDDKRVIGIKNVSATDPFLIGHFPDDPIYPGVLLIESCSQVGGMLFINHKLGRGFLAKVKNFTFLNFIRPGDSINIEVVLKSKLGSIACVESIAKVGNMVVGKGEIIYSFTKKSK